MKKALSVALSLIMVVMSLFLIVSCDSNEIETGERLYTEDTTLGSGKTTFKFIVEHANSDKYTFTVNTDKTILGDALVEAGLIEGENGPYGLYVKSVNGTSVDYNTSGGYYWSLYEGEKIAMTGVDGITINPSVTYAFKVTK
ncbi:MAG: hypothetical protein IJ398_06780 [Clostridia bacterium]|nr:hypothetical protein [Clostridia bacterium]